MSEEADNEDIRQALAVRKYELVRVLGEGAFAKALLCRDLNKKMDVACKVVRKLHVNEEWAKSNMVREAEIPSTFRHPHVVQVLGAFQTHRFMFTFMELASGGELKDVMYPTVTREIDGKEVQFLIPQPIEINQLVTWFSHIASALLYIHQKGYAHRDLKPDNVLIDQNKNAKLADFGFLTRIRTADGKLSSTICGTRDYQSPEIGSGRYDASLADVWALGQILYEMLYGHVAFQARENDEMLRLKREGRLNLDANRQFRRRVHPLLTTLITRMMEPRPETRITSKQVIRYIAEHLIVIF